MLNFDSSKNNSSAGGSTNPNQKSQSIVIQIRKTVDHAHRYYKQIQSNDAKTTIISMLAKQLIGSKNEEG